MSEKPTTILVVDDTESNRYAVSRILRQANFTVQEAATGQEALRRAAANPDLIVLDVRLPDMSGYEVCQRLKANPATATTPVLHLSASFVASEDRSEGLEYGADGYLTYPLEPRELLATVKALLRARRAEQAMRAQSELLHVTLNSIADGVISTDTQAKIVFINPVAQQLTGWGQEAIGRPLEEVFHILNEYTGEPVENPVKQVIRSGAPAALTNHTVLVARDGSHKCIDDNAAPMWDAEGHFIGVVLVFRDITDRRRLEEELRQRSEDLAQRDRRKDEFLAMLGHELRNPVAPISNSLQYLRLKFADDPEFEEAGGVMVRQLAHLTRLVEDLMDVSRITRGKFELRKRRIDLATVIERAVETTQPFLEERQHQLEVRFPPKAIPLEADPDRLEQVVTNLLTNAGKYTPPGGRIQLCSRCEQGMAIIQVQDNGIGIRPEMLARLFDMFQQADRVPGRVSEGLGIGLTLVRTLVEMHGGTVTGHSGGAGQGSEFEVRLPLAAVVAERSVEPATKPSGNNRHALRILAVDDNIDGAESLARLLRYKGHVVRVVYDGPSALEAALAFRPEVVLMDIGLPLGMDGHEVAQRLRTLPEMQKTLFVALTGYGQEEDRVRSSQAGFAAHLIKPVDLNALQELLAKAPALE